MRAAGWTCRCWVVGAGAGAPGFEPGITGPKPVALPLGHAPSGPRSLAAVGEDEEERDHREDDHRDDRRPEDDEGEDRGDHRQEPRRCEDPRGLPEAYRPGVAV